VHLRSNRVMDVPTLRVLPSSNVLGGVVRSLLATLSTLANGARTFRLSLLAQMATSVQRSRRFLVTLILWLWAMLPSMLPLTSSVPILSLDRSSSLVDLSMHLSARVLARRSNLANSSTLTCCTSTAQATHHRTKDSTVRSTRRHGLESTQPTREPSTAMISS
jgi:hypothetical protein